MSKYCKEDELSYSLGAFPTFELLLNRPQCAKRIILHEKLVKTKEAEALLSKAEQLGIPIEIANRKIESLSGKENVFIAGEFSKFYTPLKGGENHIALVHPSDMGNLGTIMRTMLGFGVVNLALIGEGADEYHPKTVRASMGAVFSLNIARFYDFDDYLSGNGEQNLYPFMLKGAFYLKEIQIKSPFTLIFGNEAKGLPDSFLSLGQSIKIAHNDLIDSLNLPSAVAIALYECGKVIIT